MENTNHFTIVFSDLDIAESLGKVFEDSVDRSKSVVEYFKNRKCDVYLPDSFEFDFYERNGLIINGCFTSGSTDVNDFMVPLSKVAKHMYCEIIDDEIGKSLRYGFFNGKRASLQETLDRMKEAHEISSLGRAGQYIETQNKLDKDKSYALRIALVNRKKTSIIQELLQQGADPNSRTSGGYSCLYFAITNKNAGAVSLLLEYGADIRGALCSERNIGTCLVEACRFGAPKIVEILLDNKADPNMEDVYFEVRPIQMAIMNHMSKSVKKLMEHGAVADIGLLKLNSESFHSNHCGKLKEKLEIFKILFTQPDIRNEFIDKKEDYLQLLNVNFKTMYPGKKDEEDFDKMNHYLSSLI